MVLVFLVVLSLLLICLHIYIRYSEYGKVMDRVPGPLALPIFGNLSLGFNISPEEAWLLVRRLSETYYPIFRLWKIKLAIVMISHADHVKTILSCKKNINKMKAAKYMIFDKRGGVLWSEASIWHHRRKIINQAFTPESLEHYAITANKYADKFVTELRCQSIVFVLNIPPELLKLSMDIAMEATMGLDPDKFEPEGVEFRNAFSELSEIFTYRPYLTDRMLKFLPVGWRREKALSVINNLVEKIIEERATCRERFNRKIDTDNQKSDKKFEDSEEKKQSFLMSDVLAEAEKKGLIDRNGVSSEIMNLLLAGFETTGTQMCFILALLAENQRAQDLLRAEISKTLDAAGEDRMTQSNINKMMYLDCCIKESMRLFPAVPHYGREITDTIEIGNYKVLPGTDVMLNVYDLHRDPNFWSEPDKFEPDRFLPENAQGRHKFSFVPFGGGLRICAGRKLAMTQMKILTANIVRNFIIEPVDLMSDQKFKIKITLALDEYRLKFIRIDR